MKHEELAETIAMAVSAAAEVQHAALLEALARSRDGVTLQGAEAKPIAAAPAGSGTDASFGNTGGRLRGWALRETTGAAGATVELRDGGPAGDLVAPINLDPGETCRDWFGGGGISYTNGLFLVRLSGSVDGALYLNGGGA